MLNVGLGEQFREGRGVMRIHRSASGLAAQIENFRRILTSMPDLRLVEDSIIGGR